MKFANRRKIVEMKHNLSNLKNSVSRGLDDALDALGIGVTITMPIIALTLGVNALVYAGMAATEGIERACGVSTKTQIGKFKEITHTRGPHDNEFYYANFENTNGDSRIIYDAPVVTSGKLLPSRFSGIETGKTYSVKTFGWLAPSIVDVSEVK